MSSDRNGSNSLKPIFDQNGKNIVATSSLTSRDIKNKADHDANTVSLGGGYKNFCLALQQKFGKDFENEIRDSITESLMTKGADFKTASAEAGTRAKEIRSKLAALHDPGMVAGGWSSHEPVRMGDPLINSSIGGSWPSRLKALDESVSSAIANGSGQANMNIRLELLRGREN